jgi:hypothetical protein
MILLEDGEVYLPDSDSELENNKQIIISKNLNNLTVEERLKILKKDSPELYEFLEEFQMTFSELTKDVFVIFFLSNFF